MKNRNSFRTLIVLAAVAAGTASMAQFSPFSPQQSAASLGGTVRLEKGDTLLVRIDGQWVEKVIESEEDLKNLVGVVAKLPSKGVEGVITKMDRRACVALYPGSYFIAAGPVFDLFSGRTIGGSLSVQGLLIAASFPITLKIPGLGGKAKESEVSATTGEMSVAKRSAYTPDLTLGGWYFSRIGNADAADLYQIDARLMTNDFMGVQVAYINSTDVNAESWTLHLIGRLASNRFMSSTTPWEVTGGIGPYFNMSPRADNRQAPVVSSHKSVGLSAFVNGSMKLKDRLSLHGTMWMINDRNTLTTRLAFGVGYSF